MENQFYLKQYSTLREARWARDEARKFQIKSIKEHDQEKAKMDPHHERVSFATSQGTVLIALRVVLTQAN